MTAAPKLDAASDLPPTMTVPEVCAYLRLDRRTVYAMFKAGELEGNQRGRLIRLFTPSVVAWARGLPHSRVPGESPARGKLAAKE